MFQNINGLPTFNKHSKNEMIRGTIDELRADIFAMTEINVHWKKVPDSDRLHTRTTGWFEHIELALAYNTHDLPEHEHQWGGTAVWAMNEVSRQKFGTGSDTTGLGRWSWMRFRGEEGIVLRVISAYCPQEQGGIDSVPGQHQAYLNEINDERKPQEAFWEDLKKEATNWVSMGDILILTGDWNRDTRSSTVQTYMEELGLREVIIEKHGNDGMPATCESGSKPIDGIFVSWALNIERGGFLAFGMGCPSDHRAGWIDVTYQTALGFPMAPMVRPKSRRLQNKDPRIVKRFNDYLEQYIIFHKLNERAKTLESQVTYPMKKNQIKEYEIIDKLRVEGLQAAERQCRKLKMGAIPWSPQMAKIWKELHAWNLILKRKRNKKVSSRYLQRAIDAAGIYLPPKATLACCVGQQKSITKQYKLNKKTADIQRQTFQEGLAEARAKANGTKASTELKQLQSTELARKTSRTLKRVREKLRAGAVSFISTKDNNGRQRDVTTKTEIEALLQSTNKAKYSQTNDTPFMNDPLLQDFNHLGTGPAATEVMNGTFVPPDGVDKYAALLLKTLERTAAAKLGINQATWLETETWQKSWRSGVREHTSSGPSAMHFGTLMAGAQSDFIAEFDAIMTNIPMISGYSPSRWRKAIDAMLLKKQGLFLLEKLRTIVLFEPDFNWLNKLLGWTMMNFAESTGQLAPEQYGSRKFHKAIDQVVNKILTFDIMRQTKRPGALCSNDAKSCYDRIVHAVAALCMKRNRIAEPAIVCMFTTIQELEHTVRTAYGDSTSSYKGDLWALPLQGVMQGNGAGPAIWAIVSSPVLDMLRNEGFGTFFHTAITGEKVRFVGYSFVDDTDLVHTAEDEQELPSSVMKKMQEAIDLWEGGIRATGGAIATDKTYWYPITFIWKAGKWRLASTFENPYNLSVLNHKGNRIQLEKMGPDEAKETLGVYAAPSGTMGPQMEVMIAASKRWADQIRAGRLKRADAWIGLTTTIWKTFEYPLPALTLTYQECENIMRPALRAGLQASGICANLPRAVVFGPLKYQGLGLPHLYTTMCTNHIEDILSHCHQQTITGALYRTSIEALVLEAGVGPNVFEWPYPKFKEAVTHGLAQHTWKFLSDTGMHIKTQGIHMPLRRDNDEYIMRIFHHRFKAPTLAKLNRCRIFLQVTTIADITTGDGRFLTDGAVQGRLDDTRPHYYNWPTQQRPPTPDWQTWQQALKTCFSDGKSKRLRRRLGDWVIPDPNWTWYYEVASQRLFEKIGDNICRLWVPVHRRRQRSSTQRFENTHLQLAFPDTAEKATVFASGLGVRLSGTSPTTVTTEEPNRNLADTITLLDVTEKWSMQDVTNDDDGTTLARAIADEVAIAVSDGSYKDNYGTAAWVVQGTTPTGEARGVNIAPGYPEDQSAYRSELAGLHGIISFVNTLCKYHNINAGQVEVGCDGLIALKAIFGKKPISSKTTHFDLISATRRLLELSPICWKSRHVKGHQDDRYTAQHLDRWATLNIEMDQRAKQYLIEAQEKGQTGQIELSLEPWSLWVHNKKVVKHIKTTVYEAAHAKPLQEYWTGRKHPRMTNEQYHQIDWPATEKAMKATPLTRRHWITKHTTGICSVGKNAKRWRLRETDKCPRCGETEDAAHVWRCRHQGAIQQWTKSVDSLTERLERLMTDTEVIQAIKTRLYEWKTQQPPSIITTTFPGLRDAVEEQDELGWQNFLEGTLSTQWQFLQGMYYKSLGSRRTSLRWVSALIRKLWDVAWDQWQHRNGALHDRDNYVTLDEIEAVELQVRQEFDTGLGPLPAKDSSLFSGKVDRILHSSLYSKKKWLNHVRGARARHHRRVQTTFPRERALMRRWLQLAPVPA